MQRVLLTRSQGDAEALANKIHALGYETYIEPLLAIAPVKPQNFTFQNAQAVLVTSAHAFDFISNERVGEVIVLPCFCVGAHTALAAQAFGFGDVRNADGNGMSVAQTIIKDLDPRKGVVLHIGGRDRDKDAAHYLEAHNFSVVLWTTYCAETTVSLSDGFRQHFLGGGIDAVLVYSTRTAETLVRLLEKSELQTCCRNVIALGISETVCTALKNLPWRHLAAAPRPTEEAMLNQLQLLLPTRTP